MKKIIALLMLLSLVFVFASCKGNVPEEEAVTDDYTLNVSNPYIDSNDDDALEGDKFMDVSFSGKSYYVYDDNYASLGTPYFQDDDFSSNVEAYVDVSIIRTSNKKSDMYIGYKAYDADGEILRDSCIYVDLSKTGHGKTAEGIKFDFPYGTSKVEFYDYTK